MKERPIIFSAPMIRALLDGRKTQTRRPVKPQPKWEEYPGLNSEGRWCGRYRYISGPDSFDVDVDYVRCPYGVHGDRLYVKEALIASLPIKDNFFKEERKWALYEENKGQVLLGGPGINEGVPWKWKRERLQARFMPRWASRITLELTGVRVERVQEIGEEDAKAEGMEPSETVEYNDGSPCYRDSFRAIWKALYGIDNPHAWDSNPWVWCISFRK